jgi:hypothetical protein
MKSLAIESFESIEQIDWLLRGVISFMTIIGTLCGIGGAAFSMIFWTDNYGGILMILVGIALGVAAFFIGGVGVLLLLTWVVRLLFFWRYNMIRKQIRTFPFEVVGWGEIATVLNIDGKEHWLDFRMKLQTTSLPDTVKEVQFFIKNAQSYYYKTYDRLLFNEKYGSQRLHFTYSIEENEVIVSGSLNRNVIRVLYEWLYRDKKFSHLRGVQFYADSDIYLILVDKSVEDGLFNLLNVWRMNNG